MPVLPVQPSGQASRHQVDKDGGVDDDGHFVERDELPRGGLTISYQGMGLRGGHSTCSSGSSFVSFFLLLVVMLVELVKVSCGR